ncbi:hypothetical protein GW17_00035129 [Ensete ventricosum]|uniref:Uncharacterized protein n=1 Tax=Ensete ventricosum TaxID=4639 RepID=A0A427AVH3_ENSVE|nr:hypothetical protein B296_00001918 [Ensete ventricosum]RWW01813.1 hypothetical protein GW17_00035129 [Ensete ventricosum]
MAQDNGNGSCYDDRYSSNWVAVVRLSPTSNQPCDGYDSYHGDTYGLHRMAVVELSPTSDQRLDGWECPHEWSTWTEGVWSYFLHSREERSPPPQQWPCRQGIQKSGSDHGAIRKGKASRRGDRIG